jgi:hypothetical protein
MFSNRTRVIFTALTVLLAGSACLFSPDKGDGDVQSGYYTPADSAWKVLHNFQLAYETKNIDAYLDCLHEEFEFILLEVDWDDYDGDGIIDESWGRDLEEQFTTSMFSSPAAEVIELTLNGTGESIWYGDSTLTTLQLQRSFELKVYFWNSQGEPDGSRAQGNAIFLCKPNADGEYQIWQWTDLSET